MAYAHLSVQDIRRAIEISQKLVNFTATDEEMQWVVTTVKTLAEKDPLMPTRLIELADRIQYYLDSGLYERVRDDMNRCTRPMTH